MEEEQEENIEEEMDRRYGPRRREGLRPRKPPTNMTDGYKLLNMEGGNEYLIFAQLNAKQGLKTFGIDGEKALEKELKQLHMKDVIEPMDPSKMSYATKKEALNYLMYLTEKRNGDIKGRGCVDGRKQRVYMTKEKTSSPTVTTEAIMLTAGIDAKERRDMAMSDMPGAFLQADMEGPDVYVKLAGEIAELLVKMFPEKYQIYVTCLLYTSPSPRDQRGSRMPSSA